MNVRKNCASESREGTRLNEATTLPCRGGSLPKTPFEKCLVWSAGEKWPHDSPDDSAFGEREKEHLIVVNKLP